MSNLGTIPDEFGGKLPLASGTAGGGDPGSKVSVMDDRRITRDKRRSELRRAALRFKRYRSTKSSVDPLTGIHRRKNKRTRI